MGFEKFTCGPIMDAESQRSAKILPDLESAITYIDRHFPESRPGAAAKTRQLFLCPDACSQARSRQIRDCRFSAAPWDASR